MRKDKIPSTNQVIYQDPQGFCYSIDSLLLMEFAKVSGKVCDLGAGTGVLSLIAGTNVKVSEVVAAEKQEKLAEALEKSIVENNLEEKIKIEQGCISTLVEKYASNYFDSIVMNPPYFKNSLENSEEKKKEARHGEKSLELFIKTAKYLVKNGGKIYLVYPTSRMGEVLYLLKNENIEAKRMVFIKKNIDSGPYAFLLEARKSGGVFLKIERDIVLYKLNGEKSQAHLALSKVK